MNEEELKAMQAQQLLLATCVYKLMAAAAVRCEDHCRDRSEWDKLRDELDRAFEYRLGYS